MTPSATQPAKGLRPTTSPKIESHPCLEAKNKVQVASLPHQSNLIILVLLEYLVELSNVASADRVGLVGLVVEGSSKRTGPETVGLVRWVCKDLVAKRHGQRLFGSLLFSTITNSNKARGLDHYTAGIATVNGNKPEQTPTASTCLRSHLRVHNVV